MITPFNPFDFLKKHRKKILGAIVLFWIVFAVLMIIENEVASNMTKMKIDPIDRVQYIIRFVIWTFLTPVIMYFTIKNPVKQSSIFNLVVRHFFFALSIILVEFVIEIPIVR